MHPKLLIHLSWCESVALVWCWCCCLGGGTFRKSMVNGRLHGTTPTNTASHKSDNNNDDAHVQQLWHHSNPTFHSGAASRQLQSVFDPTIPITFAEFPINTTITNQYSPTKGVVFTGTTFISTYPTPASVPTAGPTSVQTYLSGSPRFRGPISGYFVDANTSKTIAVQSMSFTIGNLSVANSTRLQWFDLKGIPLGQLVNTNPNFQFGQFTISNGGNIASFQISSLPTEPIGFVIDNFASRPIVNSIVFRNIRQDVSDGSWGSSLLDIPGFDHVAFYYNKTVYECHPGYTPGVYVSSDLLESRTILKRSGVQNVHSLKTFQHYSTNNTTTIVIDFVELPITDNDALVLRNAILNPLRNASGFLGFASIPELVTKLSPDRQKGSNNSFTGCGFIEYAAEMGFINSGQGYIPNPLEQITTPNATYPLLSPQLLFYAMQHQDIVFTSKQFIKGFFDNVDYIIRDPLGRRTGFVNATINFTEIPTTFASPQGAVKYLVISNPLPGPYLLTTFNANGKVGTAVLEVSGQSPVTIPTVVGGNTTSRDNLLVVPIIPGSRGDVNGDGVINSTDTDFLLARTPSYANGFVNSGDINGDGFLEGVDVELLSRSIYSQTTKSSVLFREIRADVKDGSWGTRNLNIPGFDHVAFNFFGAVFEAHPGYRNGVYISADGRSDAVVSSENGVQNEHTYLTFKHYSGNASTPVIDFKEIIIDDMDAFNMLGFIRSKLNQAGFLGFASVDEFVATNGPKLQKGAGMGNNYTGCGLVEWAAELAGINRGEGFFPDALESIVTPNETYPLLSPSLMLFQMQNQDLVFNATQTIKGYFDPVNYLVTDPLGRRTGVTDVTRFNEIPATNFNKEGKAADIEHLVIYNPIPGEYKMKVNGIPGSKGVAVLEVAGRPATTVRTTGDNATQERSIVLPVVSGSRGDVNGDGSINQADLTLLKQKIPAVVGGFANTGDMNADGRLDQPDVDLLSRLLMQLSSTPSPARTPTRSPLQPSPPTPDNECPQVDRCGNILLFQRYRMRRNRGSRCVERCILRLGVRLKRSLGWKCGSCDR